MHTGITAVQSTVKQDLTGFPGISPLTILIGYRHNLLLHHGKAVMQGFGCLWIAGAPLMLPGTFLCVGALQLKIAFSKANALYEYFCADWFRVSLDLLSFAVQSFLISFWEAESLNQLLYWKGN